ncbi:coiled-coil domain-containing protein [Paenibacillus sp. sgz500958]|uniref:coiled-coil domain-containing protein n=1 Tax=Paenibacillus sp. sgz500958 TaxID=3242475 RepID=UPI0036D2333D
MFLHRFNKHRTAAAIITLCCTMLLALQLPILSAEPAAEPFPAFSPTLELPDDQETKDLLQKTLSVVEIDQEISRISANQTILEKKIELLKQESAEKESGIAEKQEHAGAVVRAYYMGERDGLLAAFLSAKSLSKLFALIDYYEITVGRDHEILSQYEEEYKELQATIQSVERSTQELADLKMRLEEQKIRVAALNQDIESGINSSSNPDEMSALLEEFTAYWENVGLHEVKTYFRALSKAMKNLPDFIQNKDGVLERHGLTYQLKLKEEILNEFLRSQNDLFQNFAFQFDDNAVIAGGKSGNLSLTLKGHYTIQKEPVSGLMFHVDSIVFNSLELPDTTCKALEEEFDLGFYPEKIVSFLHATEVQSTDGVLYVKLSISL